MTALPHPHTAPEDGPRLPFFLYGTLRPGQRHYEWALRGRTASEEPASLAGLMLYEGPGYPYAVAGVDPARTVRGELVLPQRAHYAEVLAVLDRLEDYSPGGADNVYTRIATEVTLDTGGAARAWVYLAADPLAGRLRTTGTPIPSGDWVRDSADPAVRSR
ncbi:gamma-glutamylcyclotransferase family protein [Streptomyces tardus]|uniref:gamma-glutamylcyclotransferase family protein n=1 Tax=Streptomyces tardus TaxID=2780544 RepID=UPI0027E5A4A6|nr:gamma-glutamylcyclotransferase family protein [Streptomyces tardus]